jgi:transposase
MNKIKLVGIDLAKRCYQICALDEQGQVLYNRKYSAQKFVLAVHQLEPTRIAMEACAAAHYWGRRLQTLGHVVKLIPPQHAKAFRRVHKSDAHDALSIVEAAQRPNLHGVPVKTLAQQDLQMLGGLRERCVAQRTALINQARGFARE